MTVYKSSKFSIWEVACALECTEKQAKQVLGRAYDPYIEHKLDREREDKARRLYDEGLSLGQIKFRVKADEWEIKTWVGEGLISESKARLRREARERRAAGESVQSICDDMGINLGTGIGYLSGMYEHPLDLYGIGLPERDRICSLYRDEGFNSKEIGQILGFDEELVSCCIDDFCWLVEDESRHDSARQRRIEKDGEIVAVARKRPVIDEEALRIEASRAMAARAGIDEDAARKYFEDNWLPSRAQLAKDMNLRVRFAKAMLAQEKTVEQIAIAIDVSENVVKRYLGDEYTRRGWLTIGSDGPQDRRKVNKKASRITG